MKKTIVAMALALAACLGAQQRGTPKIPGRVTVYLDAYLEPVLAAQATAAASDMFGRIGVKIEWRRRSRSGRPDTSLASQQDDIRISFRTATPPALLPGAMARAWPSDGVRIEVLYDRVQAVVEPRGLATLLAHVLVHEIAHVLQGVARHSDSGVMKANWDNHDYMNMKWKSLPFTQEDVALIHRGMDMSLQADRSLPEVTVYVKGDGAPPPSVDYAARATVKRMFAGVGIRLAWRDGAAKESAQSGNTVSIQVQFADKSNNASPGALAFALPFGEGATAITVMYQRIRAAAGQSAREQPILAHVLAHEICHVLQRTQWHAPTGVMKARWTGQDFDAMMSKPLEFTTDDVDLMAQGLATLKAQTIR